MRHHIVQGRYLLQWSQNDHNMQTYLIPENKYQEKGPGWKVFWREDYNIVGNDEENYYLPEKVTAHIDTEGLKAIKKIDLRGKKR